MSFSRAKAALEGTRFQDLRWVPETGSTNADMHSLLAAAAKDHPGDPADIVLVADHQRAGRGRLDRVWEAPARTSLLMTVGTTRPVADERRGLLLTAMSLAAVEAMDAEVGFIARIKWPNDLIAVGVGDDGGDRKVAGVLAEAAPLQSGQVALAVGIGINCNWGEIHESLAGVATSLDILIGLEVDREAMASAVVGGFSRRLELLSTAEGAAAVVAEAKEHSETLGRDVVVHQPGGDLAGRAVDLAPDGALLIESGESGDVSRVAVGDVVHLRPA